MTFAWPQLLWLLLVPLALLAWELTHRRRTSAAAQDKILRAEAGPHSLRLAAPGAASPMRSSPVRPWLCLALACGVLAVARPQWGRIEEPVFDQAREILIAIDLSRSMLAPDVKPSRLDRAKLLTQSLLEKLSGERVGLIVFSGTAFLQSPLSSDYEILREFLPALDPEFLPEGGTNYRALIDTSLAAFASSSSADRFLIVLSDGEATEDDWRARLGELKTRGIRVLGLGVGTDAGAMIPDGAGGLVKDERGAVVLSKLESGTLRELATATNGVYQDASAWIDLAALISNTVDAGQKGQFLEKNTVRLVERFQWPLAFALWFLLVSLYYEFPVRPKPRAVKLRGQVPAPSAPSPETRGASATTSEPTITLIALLLGFASLLPTPSRAAETPASPEPPLLSRIVGRLSAAPQRTARDWAEFGRETVTWGTRLQSSQQPVPEGPVRDALAAVELGAAADPKTTDWPKLRAELEALLQKPEDQQQDQQNQDQQQQDQKQNQSQNDQQKQDQQKQDQQKSSPQDQQNQEQQKQEQQEQEQEQGKQPPPENQQEQEKAFGDMKDHEPPPPPPQETQKVGGVPEKKDGEKPPPTDPALALPLQKLEQLRNQDSPAELFQLMEDPKDATPRKKTKDW